jgi:hypothetical protein
MRGKLLRTFLVIGWIGAVGTIGSFSAFTAQTDNPGNTVTAGSISIADNDGGSALYDMPDASPGESEQSCIRVVYTGSVDADVKIYTPSTIGDLGPYVNLKIEAGTQLTPSFPDCTLFIPDAVGATIYDGALSSLGTTYGTGVLDYPFVGTGTEWVNNDAVIYRVTATLSATTPGSAQGDTTGSHTLRWEAHSQ